MIEFPQNFIWGTSTSAYQIEGAWNLYGKGPSVWDAFCMIPGKTKNGETGEVACDHYHKFKDDIRMMKEMGLKVYRFSISWSRIMPSGRGEVNEAGVQFYNDLIDELLANGIQPWATLNHFDLPLALEFEFSGWLSKTTSDYFAEYAKICFDRFGDRVKNWLTFNEVWVVSMLSYGQGVFAPGRTSNYYPYLAAHHMLLAHGKAVKAYRNDFQKTQQGKIGITNNCDWREPLTNKVEDKAAAQRALEFYFGWLSDPLFFGRYPNSMVERLGDRLPSFTQQESEMIKGSIDFIGLNHYNTFLASDAKGSIVKVSEYGNLGIAEDQDVNLSVDPSWTITEMGWPVVPEGMYKLLKWIDERYNHPVIYVTENGGAFSDKLENGQVIDQARIDYLDGYIRQCHRAIKDGVDVRGYFVWSFLDNFEWALGYEKRFGLHYVDFETKERIPKESARWYKEVIEKNGL